jgi:hypothetical protein
MRASTGSRPGSRGIVPRCRIFSASSENTWPYSPIPVPEIRDHCQAATARATQAAIATVRFRARGKSAAAARAPTPCIGIDPANAVLRRTGTAAENASSVTGKIHAPRAARGLRPVRRNQAKTHPASRAKRKLLACQVDTATPSARLARRIEIGVRMRAARTRRKRWSANQGTLKSSLIRIHPIVR